jgi:RNA polymerase sigma factor (sigma-70 family)
MSDGDRTTLARFVRRLAELPRAAQLSDAELLERFVAQQDGAAFELLLWRHGPKVLGVCRRVLRHEQDAEDAFQATFLVLARKAASVGRREAIGPWLYRVAYRVALRAKARADRRPVRQARPEDVPAVERTPDLIWADLRPVLDEEVSRLPGKYRAAFVLCYLDGKTNEEAARELGCPTGTVLSRLAWARERLRGRLARRGLAPCAGLAAAALTGQASAAVPAALARSTLKAALPGAGALGVVSAQVDGLTKGALRAMLWSKAVSVTVCVLTVGGVGVALAWQAVGARPAAARPADGPEKKAGRPAAPAERERPKTFPFEMRDKPWVQVLEWYSDVSGLPFAGNFKPTGTFTFLPPRHKRQFTLAEITDILNEALLSQPATQRYLLVRRHASFTLLPADEKIDPTLVPRVRPDDLDKRGRTELVTVALPLTELSAEDVAPDVKKLLGPFGEVVTLGRANQLIVRDTAGNLRLIRETIKDIEAHEAREARKKKAPEKKG